MWLSVLLVLFVSVIVWLLLRKPSDYPPGPWGLPLIGWPPLNFEDFRNKLLKWKNRNHDIIGWRIGSEYVVVIFDYDLMKEAFQHPNLAFRPDFNILTYIQGNKEFGIIHSANDRYTQNRRFLLRHLRDFGMGREKLLFGAHIEANIFIDDWKKSAGKVTTIPSSLLVSSLNNVWEMISNVKVRLEEKEMSEIFELVEAARIYGSKIMILDLFPWMKKVLPSYFLNNFLSLQIQKDLSEKVFDYFKRSICNRMKSLKENEVTDYISAYLLEMEKQKNQPDSFMSIKDLTICVTDLFFGAMETTNQTIRWAVLYLAAYQNVQKKLQEEIDRVLPKGTQFLMKDKTSLPYTEAFIHEILRISSIAPSPPRAAAADTKIGSYVIPKGSWVMGHTWIIHHNPKYWDSPNELRPERFLNSEGKFVAPTVGFLPFGTGRRSCIGETIARMQLFVFLTKVVQNFHFDCPPGEKIIFKGVLSPFFRPAKEESKIYLKIR